MKNADIKKMKRDWKRYVELTGITRSRIEELTGIAYGRIIDLGRENRPTAIPSIEDNKSISSLVVDQAHRIQRRVLYLENENALTEQEFRAINSDFSGIPVPQAVSIVGRYGMIGTAPASASIDMKQKTYEATISSAKRSKDDVRFDNGIVGLKREFSFLRRALCLTNADLGELSGYSPQTVQDWSRLKKLKQTPHPDLLFDMRKKASIWAHQVIQQSQAPHAGGDEFSGIVSPVFPLEYSGSLREVTFRRIAT